MQASQPCIRILHAVYNEKRSFPLIRSSPDAKLVRMDSGEVLWTIDGRSRRVSAGDIVLLSPLDWRQFTPQPGTAPFAITQMCIHTASIPPAMMNLFYLRPAGFDNVLPRSSPHFPHVESLFREIETCAEQKSPSPLDAEFLSAALDLLCVRLRYIYDSCLSAVSARQSRFLFDIFHYIDTHLGEERLSTSGVAEAFYCTPAHLSRTFHQLAGLRLSEYIRRVRILTVLRLLSDTDRSVLSAAMEAGFRSSSAFYKAFREETGMTPREFIRG